MTLHRLLFYIILLALSQSGLCNDNASPSSVAFYYGNETPIGRLMAYDWAVLQQDQASDARIDLLKRAGTIPISYVSVGEMERSHPLFTELQPAWRIGRNPAWSSEILDLRKPEVRRFILEQLIAPAMRRGFQGVFLDTLDSFELAVSDSDKKRAFALAQRDLIDRIRERYPQARIILNRGFHLPNSVINKVDAVALESWRSGYDAGEDTYYEISDSDRDWLKKQLAPWREARPELPLIAIDYVDDFSRAPELAQQLREDGFIPWVSNPELTRLSPAQPRQVKNHTLVIHDLPEHNMDESAAHRFGGIVLERLGLVPQYHSTRQPLPSEPTSDRYAGILVWLERGGNTAALCSWLAQQQDQGVPVVLMGEIPTDGSCRDVLAAHGTAVPQSRMTHDRGHDSVAQYEGRRLPSLTSQTIPQAQNVNAWLTVNDERGQQFTPVYTHDDGGVAATPFLFETVAEGDLYWLFDPFDFLRQAFGSLSLPAIDTTTESGRRILTAHVDGDAFVSRAEFEGTPLSAQVLMEQILERYRIPHTISVVEAEVSSEGIHPEAAREAERLARRIFRMDSVEVASHTYSHPFFWQTLGDGPTAIPDNAPYGFFMAIPGYKGSLEREISGSINYINNELASPEKPVSVYQWSGDARPGRDALRRVREAGLYNVNGGNTQPLPYGPELTATSPNARPVGDELQVYAPVMNENVYTNGWSGPFYGFRNVIDTFRILEENGRLKPISIYYHFYSATKPESLSALKDVYNYALEQPVTPLYLSDYAERVQTQYYSALLQDGDGGWLWHGIGQPHTIRVSHDRFPDLSRSRGVAGYHDTAGNRYIHLTGDAPRLILSQTSPSGPWLEQANGVITRWKRQRDNGRWRVTVGLNGHQPLTFSLAGTEECQQPRGNAKVTNDGNRVRVEMATQKIDALILECQ